MKRAVRDPEGCWKQKRLGAVVCLALVHSTDRALGSSCWLGSFRGAWLEAREVLVTKLTTSQVGNQAAGNVWFNLGVAQEARGSADAAIRSYDRAVRAFPSHRHAALNQALLLVKRKTSAAVKRAEQLLRSALAVFPDNPGAIWNLGLLLAHRGSSEANATLSRAIDVTHSLGWSTRRLAMVLPLTKNALGQYMSQLDEELSEFTAFCAESPHLAALPALRSALPAALAELRKLPDDPSWLVSWAAETAQTFGPDTTAAAYGETLFASWKAVTAHPAVAEVMSEAGHAIVLGSALGYQCLYFVAAGMPCVGYDLLEVSMVLRARKVARDHGLAAAVDFQVGDALTVPLRAESKAPSILWLNDEVWPTHLSRDVAARAARELEPGSIVISYGPDVRPPPAGLQLVESMRVPTSWCESEVIRILRTESV